MTMEARAGALAPNSEWSDVIDEALAAGARDESVRAVINYLWSTGILGRFDPVEQFVNGAVGRLAQASPLRHTTATCSCRSRSHLRTGGTLGEGGRSDCRKRGRQQGEAGSLALACHWAHAQARGIRPGRWLLARDLESAFASNEPQRILPMAAVAMPRAILAGDTGGVGELADAIAEMTRSRRVWYFGTLPIFAPSRRSEATIVSSRSRGLRHVLPARMSRRRCTRSPAGCSFASRTTPPRQLACSPRPRPRQGRGAEATTLRASRSRSRLPSRRRATTRVQLPHTRAPGHSSSRSAASTRTDRPRDLRGGRSRRGSPARARHRTSPRSSTGSRTPHSRSYAGGDSRLEARDVGVARRDVVARCSKAEIAQHFESGEEHRERRAARRHLLEATLVERLRRRLDEPRDELVVVLCGDLPCSAQTRRNAAALRRNHSVPALSSSASRN